MLDYREGGGARHQGSAGKASIVADFIGPGERRPAPNACRCTVPMRRAGDAAHDNGANLNPSAPSQGTKSPW
jgi:hypothetical protein